MFLFAMKELKCIQLGFLNRAASLKAKQGETGRTDRRGPGKGQKKVELGVEVKQIMER